MSISKIIQKMPEMFFNAQKLSNFPPNVTQQALHDDNSGPDEAVDSWVQQVKQNQFGEFTTTGFDLDELLEDDPDAIDKAVFQISNPGAMIPPPGMQGTLLPPEAIEAIILQYPGVVNMSTGIASKVMGSVDEILEEADIWHENIMSDQNKDAVFMALQQSGGDPSEMAAMLTHNELQRIGRDNLEGDLPADDSDSDILGLVASAFENIGESAISLSRQYQGEQNSISDREQIINDLNLSLANDEDIGRAAGTEIASQAVYTGKINFIRENFPGLFEDWFAQNRDRIDPDIISVIAETITPPDDPSELISQKAPPLSWEGVPYVSGLSEFDPQTESEFYSTPPLVPRPEGYEGPITTKSRFDDIDFDDGSESSAAQQASAQSLRNDIDSMIAGMSGAMPDARPKSMILSQEFGRTPGAGMHTFVTKRDELQNYADMMFSMHHPDQKYTDEAMEYDVGLSSQLSPTGSSTQDEYRTWMRSFFDSPSEWIGSELGIADDIVNDMRESEKTGTYKGHAVNFHPSNTSEMNPRAEKRWMTLINRLGIMGAGPEHKEAVLNTMPLILEQFLSQGMSYSDITERILGATRQRQSGVDQAQLERSRRYSSGLNQQDPFYREGDTEEQTEMRKSMTEQASLGQQFAEMQRINQTLT